MTGTSPRKEFYDDSSQHFDQGFPLAGRRLRYGRLPRGRPVRTAMELTAAKLRYLMTVSELRSGLPHKIRCVDVAVRLGVARPTASRMLAALCREGMLLQSRETGFRLSGEGEQLVFRYQEEYRLLIRYFRERLGLPDYDAREAAMALLLTVPAGTRAALRRAVSQTL